jgi:hypothetical protein
MAYQSVVFGPLLRKFAYLGLAELSYIEFPYNFAGWDTRSRYSLGKTDGYGINV